MPKFKDPIADPGLDTVPSKHPPIRALIKPDPVTDRA
jgi:hypothetical protein